MTTPNDRPGIISWGEGYSKECLDAAEKRWNFVFPPDLKRLLLTHQPIGRSFWDWSTATDADMVERQSFVSRGIAFDVVYNGFWMEGWGKSPDLSDAPKTWGNVAADTFVDQINREFIAPIIAQAPPLIPIFSHRFMPSDPHVDGLPILSVMQTDIIFYGLNLRDYFHNEFSVDIGPSFGTIYGRYGNEKNVPDPLRVTFWSDLIDVAWSQE